MKEIHYLLGNACNLSCDFCFWDKRTTDVSWSVKKKIINSIANTNIKKVTISGGEPFINIHLYKILKEFHKNKIQTVIHTNGIKYSDDFIMKIKPYVKRISLSLDGSNKDMCIKMRKDARTYDKVVELMGKLSKADINFSVKTLVTSVNESDISNIGKLLEQKKVKYWSLLEFNPINRGMTYKNKFELDDETFDSIANCVKNEFPKIPIRIRLFKRKPEAYCFILPNADVYTYIPYKGDILIGSLINNSLNTLIKKFN